MARVGMPTVRGEEADVEMVMTFSAVEHWIRVIRNETWSGEPACNGALSTAPVDCTCLVEAPSFLLSSTSTGRCVDPSSAASGSVVRSRAPLERVAPDNDWSVTLRFFLGSAAGGG